MVCPFRQSCTLVSLFFFVIVSGLTAKQRHATELLQQGDGLIGKTRNQFGLLDINNPQYALRLFNDALAEDPVGLCGVAKLRQGLAYWNLRLYKESSEALFASLKCTSPALAGQDLAEAHLYLAMLGENYCDGVEKNHRLAIQAVERAGLEHFPWPFEHLGYLKATDGYAKESQSLLRTAAKHAHPNGDHLLLFGNLVLPRVYEDETDLLVWRREFVKSVDTMQARGLKLTKPERLGGAQQYYLSYHGLNDVDINRKLSQLMLVSAPSLTYVAPHLKHYLPPSSPAKIKVAWPRVHVAESQALLHSHVARTKACDHDRCSIRMCRARDHIV
jgi:hypothetical protein